MVRIAISVEAFEAIAKTLPLGNVGYENKTNERGERLIWLAPQARLERVLKRNLGPSSIPSLGDGVILGTAWIDRPVDTQGCTPASTSLPCSMDVQPYSGPLGTTAVRAKASFLGARN